MWVRDIAVPLCGLLLLGSQCAWSQEHAQRGAVLGGLSGALVGAGIGEHNDDPAAGALIGSAVGLLTGAAVGKSLDDQAAREAAYRNYAHQLRSQQLARAVTTADVLTMTSSGVSPNVIANQVRQYGVHRRPTVDEVISLHRHGVADSVISAMQQARVVTRTLPVRPVNRLPVVVHEYHYDHGPGFYFSRPPYGHFHHHHRPYRHHHRPGFSWGISVHN